MQVAGRYLTFLSAAIAVWFTIAEVPAADFIKANNTTNLNTGGSWVGGVAPTIADTLVFNDTFAQTGNLGTGGALTYEGVRVDGTLTTLININNTTAANYLRFGAGGIDLSNATRDLRIANLGVSADQEWKVGAGRTLTVGTTTASGFTGAYSITTSGAGTVLFNGTSTATGNLTINDGVFDLSGSGQFFAGSATYSTQVVTVNAGGTLQVRNFGKNTNTATSLGNLDLDAARVVVDGGTIIFTQTANNGRAITVGAGGATLNVDSGVTWTQTNANANVYANNAALSLGGAGNGVIQNIISGAGVSVTKQNAGTWTLTGLNTFTGGVAINNGTLAINTLTNAGAASSLGTTSEIQFGNGGNTGTLQYTGAASTTNRQVRIGGTGGGTGGATIENTGTGALVFSNPTFNIAQGTGARTLTLGGSNTGNNEIQGLIQNNSASGVLGITKAGAGTWILSNSANTFTGGVAVNNGVLVVSSLQNAGVASSLGAAIGADSVIRFGNQGNTGELRYTGGATSTNRQIQIGTNTATVGHDGGAIIDKNNAGALVFSNPVFNITQANVTAARTLQLSGGSGAANTIQGVIQDNNNSGGTVGLTKADGGRWILSNPANTFSGLVALNNGVLEINTLNDVGVASSLGAGNLIRFGNNGNTGTLRYLGAATSTDRQVQIGNGAGGGGVGGATIQNQGTGALTFTNATFNVAHGDAGNRALTLAGTNPGINEIQGAIQDNVNGNVLLVKEGANTWALSGDNTYSGTTTLVAGRLNVDGIHTGGGNYFVQSGAVLGGSGTIDLAPGSFVTVAANPGIISPGAGFSNSNPANPADVGTLTLSGGSASTLLDLAGILQIDIASAALYDQLVIEGTVDLGANSILNINGVTDFSQLDLNVVGLGVGDYIQFLSADSIDGSFSNFPVNQKVVTAGGLHVIFGQTDTELFLLAIPEPATYVAWALLGLSVAGGVVGRRVRKRRADLVQQRSKLRHNSGRVDQ